VVCPLKAEFGQSILREGGRMARYPDYAWERAMKIQEVILQARAKMLLHLDGSHHRWFPDDRCYGLIEVLDDNTVRLGERV
jgi:hypothetical protein